MDKDFQIENVLVVQTSFLGDVVLGSVVWEKIHELYPNCKIDVLVRKGNEGLLVNHPFLREVLIWDKKQSKYLNLFRLLKKVRQKRYDMVVNLQRFFSTGLICGFSNAKLKLGFKQNPLSFLFTSKINYVSGVQTAFIHETEKYHQLIVPYTDQKKARMKIYPSSLDQSSIDVYTEKPFVTMFPASVWKTKELPINKWVELINEISDQHQIFLCGGPADIQLCNIIAEKINLNKPVVLAGKLTLLESAALMKKAKMNYCNDSAPTHMASALNTPVTTFFMSTVPGFGFTPLSDDSRIIEISEKLDCRPCGIHGKNNCPKGHFKCGEQIKIQSLKI